MGFRRSSTWRSVEPHQVAHVEGRRYVVVWCRLKEGWSHSRTDRVLSASLEAETFAPRADHHDRETPAQA